MSQPAGIQRRPLFRLDATDEYKAFISPRAQLLNQDPSLLNC